MLWLGMCASIACGARAAEAPALILEHLTPSEGMPQGTVYATLQDSQGFVWLATEDGLVRYDGHELVRYAYSRSASKGLPGNFIREIAEDAHHDLWLAIKDAGIARWNRATDDFTVYRHDPANPGSLASDTARAVLIDRDGKVWVGTGGAGVDVLDPVSGAIEHFRHDPKVGASLSDDDIFSLNLDRQGVLWVGTAGGLDQWQADGRVFRHFRHAANDPTSLSGTQISGVAEDRFGELWVGTFDGGLDRMDRSGRVSAVYRHDAAQPGSLSSDDVRGVLEDHAGHLWVGTADGLDLFDRTSGSFTRYRHEEGDAGSLRDSFVMSLYEDKAGLVWIGTLAGGVSRWNPRSWELGGHRPAWLAGKLVTSFADAAGHQLWIGSLGGGLMRFDDDTGEAVDIDTLEGRTNVLGDSRVMALQTDRRGTLWIGTMRNGLKRLSAAGELVSIPVKVNDPKGTSEAGIMTLFEARNGDLWVGTHNGGANVIDPVSGRIRQLPFRGQPGAVSAPSVSAIAEDREGNLWLGTDGGGLDLARADGSVVAVFRHDVKDAASIPSNTIYAITVDSQGTVWVATDQGGIARVEGSAAQPQTLRFRGITREDGLSSDTIYAILDDGEGHLWMSGNAGLMRYDPATRAVKTFHREHGLQGEEFDLNAYHRSPDGRLAFGGPGGFNVFDPHHLTDNTHAPRVALTRVEVLGAPVPSATPYWLVDRIELDHLASIVSLDFGALDFTSPKRNRLEYRIAGLSDRWIDLGTQHRVTLTNLDAGAHLLEVRAANADSVWSKPPLRLTLHRNPAPWRSPWAYAVYAILLLLLVLHRVRRNREKIAQIVEAKQRLELEVALRTRELVESNHKLEDASQAKSSFLARMSHELRTPMNGVVGSSELLARTPQSPTQSRLTETIRASAKVLLQIVNDLLDLSKIQADKIEFEALPLDLVAVLEECTTLFAAAAGAKGVELIIDPPPTGQMGLIGDALRVRQILMNLVGNAVKFTLQGEVVVTANVLALDATHATVTISVTDSGIGMDASTIAKIFEPFTQADESTTRRFGGSGLGLAICRELAERMGGTITVDSEPGVGSTFHAAIPLQIAAPPAVVVGSESPPHVPAQPGTPALPMIRVLTRRPALQSAVTRHLEAFGMRLSTADACDLIIADLATYRSFVESRLRPLAPAAPRAPAAAEPPLLILATSAEIEALEKTHLVDPTWLVHKPVHRERLRAALRAGLGDPAAAAAPEPARTVRVKGHVLLVEDEPVNAAVAQGYLAELGCSTVWVTNGADAVTRHAGERFNLIMMDLNMPVMDGFATTRVIRDRDRGSAGRRVPIVALTAHDAKNYLESCRAAGMDDLLSKPYTFDECAHMVERFLDASDAVVEATLGLSAPAAEVKEVVPAGAGAPAVERRAQPRQSLAEIDAPTVANMRSLRGPGGGDLYSTLVGLFRSSSRDSVAQLRQAFSLSDCKAMSTICHKLAAASANVGALAFAHETRQIEALCATGDIVRVRDRCTALLISYPVLLEEIDKLQLRASA